MKLEIESEKVLEAANSCSDTKRVLKILFPKAFEEEDVFKDGMFHGRPLFGEITSPKSSADSLIEIRHGGSLHFKAFWLNPDFEWELTTDGLSAGKLLKPTKKK